MDMRLRKLWEQIRGSYWFVPGLMAIGAILLALGSISLDSSYQGEVLPKAGFLWSGGADSTRDLLRTVAGSMITVAGIVFSATMVALSFASSQFGSRSLRNFMIDGGNQLVLGTFVGTFIYCLLVLRTIQSQSNGNRGFVPYISVDIGLLLALASIIVLIYFFHHIALSLQAPYVVGQVAADLLDAIERLVPAESHVAQERQSRNDKDVPSAFEEQAYPFHSGENGYIQGIEESVLMTLARENDLIMKLVHRPGHFQVKGDVLASVWPQDRWNEDLGRKLKAAFIIGKQRTYTQDIEFGIEQLVEVAERALALASNATFTVIACIDWLGAALAKILKRGFPSPYHYDEQGKLRFFYERPLTLVGVIDTAFNQIRQASRHNVAVRIRLLEKIAVLRKMTDDPQAVQALERQARMTADANEDQLVQRDDQREIEQRYRAATKP